MKFYLCLTAEGRKRLVTRQEEAHKLDRAAKPIDIPTDQAGLKAAFEELFDQITDLEQQKAEPTRDEIVNSNSPEMQAKAKELMAPKPEGYTEMSNRFEDEFNAMPLAQQLHYAALAMENTREAL